VTPWTAAWRSSRAIKDSPSRAGSKVAKSAASSAATNADG
jgi:hypothetical protein